MEQIPAVARLGDGTCGRNPVSRRGGGAVGGVGNFRIVI